VSAALGLAAWALVDAVLLGVPAAGAAGLALLLAGVVTTLATCRRLGAEDRQPLLTGVTAAGLVVALTGWLGVAWRVDSLAWLGDGIWRASATLTYPNAAAAVLVPLTLVVLARLDRSPPPLLVVTATGLLSGLAATLSRAGAVAFVVGLAVLACLRGPRATVRAAAGPCAGAVVALAGLVPSLPAAAPPRPVAAVTGLAAGLVLAVLVTRVAWSRVGALLATVAAVATLGGLVLVGARRPGRRRGARGGRRGPRALGRRGRGRGRVRRPRRLRLRLAPAGGRARRDGAGRHRAPRPRPPPPCPRSPKELHEATT
jgi:hypothetical protein